MVWDGVEIVCLGRGGKCGVEIVCLGRRGDVEVGGGGGELYVWAGVENVGGWRVEMMCLGRDGKCGVG